MSELKLTITLSGGMNKIFNHVFFVSLFFCCSTLISANEKSLNSQKILICGVCRDVESAVEYTIKNIETLGEQFSDYQVILYENNSKDNTAALLSEWAEKNHHVVFLSENLSKEELPPSRTEKIAKARNLVLNAARDPKYSEYEYLIMADLDFRTDWPIDEIIQTIHSKEEWDCVSSNALWRGVYGDRYAFRDHNFPLGPELLGDYWTKRVGETWFTIHQQEWLPVYSAFGGLAIYKTRSILPFQYSGTVTDDLKKYYREIFRAAPKRDPEITKYLEIIKRQKINNVSEVPIVFQHNIPSERPANYQPVTCCEHVTLHASMAIHGFGKFFINPKMKFDRGG